MIGSHKSLGKLFIFRNLIKKIKISPFRSKSAGRYFQLVFPTWKDHKRHWLDFCFITLSNRPSGLLVKSYIFHSDSVLSPLGLGCREIAQPFPVIALLDYVLFTSTKIVKTCGFMPLSLCNVMISPIREQRIINQTNDAKNKYEKPTVLIGRASHLAPPVKFRTRISASTI